MSAIVDELDNVSNLNQSIWVSLYQDFSGIVILDVGLIICAVV